MTPRPLLPLVTPTPLCWPRPLIPCRPHPHSTRATPSPPHSAGTVQSSRRRCLQDFLGPLSSLSLLSFHFLGNLLGLLYSVVFQNKTEKKHVFAFGTPARTPPSPPEDQSKSEAVFATGGGELCSRLDSATGAGLGARASFPQRRRCSCGFQADSSHNPPSPPRPC